VRLPTPEKNPVCGPVSAHTHAQWRRNEFESGGGDTSPEQSVGKILWGLCPSAFWL